MPKTDATSAPRWIWRLRVVVALWAVANAASAFAAALAYDFVYTGRLTAPGDGHPVEGPVAMEVAFYHAASGGEVVLAVRDGLATVELQDGVFQLKVTLSAADYQEVFSDVAQGVWVQISDLTHLKAYDRQAVTMVPYAAKVPVDGQTLGYNGSGQMTVLKSPTPTGTAAGNLVQLDSTARLPAVDGSQLSGVTAASVGSQSAAAVAATAATVSQAASAATAGTLVMRDSGGAFGATSALLGSVKLLSGANTLALLAPAGLAASVAYTLPAAPVNGAFLTTDATGTLTWGTPTGLPAANVPAAGVLNLTTGSVPFAAAAGGLGESNADFYWDNANKRLGLGTTAPIAPVSVSTTSAATSGTVVALALAPTYNQTSGSAANTDLLINRTKTAVGSGAQRLIDAQVGGVSKFTVADTGSVTAAAGMTLPGNGATANSLRLGDKGAINALALKAPDMLAGSTTYTLPAAAVAGNFLQTDAGGLLSWAPVTSGTVTSVTAGAGLTGGAITSSGTIDLATVGAAGTYTKVTTNAYGQVTSSAALAAADIPSLDAAKITTGQLGLANGGTGAASAGAARTSLGLGGAAVLDPGTSNTNLVQLGALGFLPALNASQLTSLTAANLTGSVAVTNGGTGAVTAAAARTNLGAAVSGANNDITSLTGLTTALPPAEGGTGLVGAPANGNLLIGNGAGYSLATLTAGTGISITNAAGGITVAATADASTKVAKGGDTMTGALSLPTDGLVVGTSELVASGGKVGIGTSAPAEGLDVYTAASYSAAFGYDSAHRVLIWHGNDNAGGFIRSDDAGGTGLITIYGGGQQLHLLPYDSAGGSSMTTNYGYLKLGSDNVSSGYIYVPGDQGASSAYNGNIGIGTTTPMSKLDINGGVAIGSPFAGTNSAPSNGLIVAGQTILGDDTTNASTNATLVVQRTVASGASYMLVKNAASNGTTNAARLALAPHFGYVEASAPYIEAINVGNDAGLHFGTYSSGLAERLTILPAGNVGIGTTSPSAKLQVAGQIVASLPSTLTPAGTTQAVDFSTGNMQVLDLGSAGGAVTLTFTNAVAGGSYAIKCIQGAAAQAVVWPASVKWPGGTPMTLTAAAGAVDLVTLFYDGTNFYAAGGNNYQ